ncbi:MAG: hypothetical protein IID45_14105, partial [Planctomycetes bacterium]|nr:hypothetical protein [Planctomycetota bacterium]
DLTNRICEAEQADGGKSFLVGMNDTAVWEIADVGGGIDPSVLAQGILCAHLSSSIGPAVGNVVRSSNDRTLILAALLQDVGMVCLPRRRSHNSEPSADNSEPSADNSEPSAEGDVKTKRLHPLWSAALVQGIRHSGQELPRLVAEHHENLLGCGFPHGLRARQLTPRSRFLAVVSSFVERVRAVLQPARESGLCEALRLENAVESGCRTLAERVRFGELDPRITTAFLEQVRMLSQVERSRFDSTPQTADSTPPFRNSRVEQIPEKTDAEESAASPIDGLRPPDGAPPKPKFLRRFNRSSVNVLFSQQGSTGAAKSPGRLISVLNPNAE